MYLRNLAKDTKAIFTLELDYYVHLLEYGKISIKYCLKIYTQI